MPRIDAASADVAAEPHNDDQVLVERLVRGDASAWRFFVENHGRLVRARVADVALTFGRGRDESSIDDATAEVFAALLGNNAAALRAFAGRSSLGTYVAVIATRSATRGFARSHLVSPAPGDLDSAYAKCDREATDPVSELIDEEQHEKLHELLRRLPNKQKNVVTLFHLQGQSYAEISDRLEMPIGSIGPTLRRAEAKLRSWLEGD